MELGPVTAVGIWLYSNRTDRYLYLLRNDTRRPSTWGLPGGKMKPKETILKTIQRECQEEIGIIPEWTKLIPLEKFTSTDSGFIYHTFFCPIAVEFCPTLNSEHIGYAWIGSGIFPKPLHPGLWSTVNLVEIQNKIARIKESIHTSQ